MGLFQGRENSGVAIQGAAKEGLITAAKITANPLNSQTALLILQGKAISPPGGIFPGLSSFFLRFDCNASAMVDLMTTEGFGHHLVVTYAEIKEELGYFAEMSGMRKVIPE